MILVLLDDDHESKGSSGLRTEIWEEEASKGGGSCNCASESERSERRTQGNGTPTTEASFLSLGSASAALAALPSGTVTCGSNRYSVSAIEAAINAGVQDMDDGRLVLRRIFVRLPAKHKHPGPERRHRVSRASTRARAHVLEHEPSFA